MSYSLGPHVKKRISALVKEIVENGGKEQIKPSINHQTHPTFDKNFSKSAFLENTLERQGKE